MLYNRIVKHGLVRKGVFVTQKWKYDVERANSGIQDLEKQLNARSAEGWEFAGYIPNIGLVETMLVFRRPVTQTSSVETDPGNQL